MGNNAYNSLPVVWGSGIISGSLLSKQESVFSVILKFLFSCFDVGLRLQRWVLTTMTMVTVIQTMANKTMLTVTGDTLNRVTSPKNITMILYSAL